jgi:inactivated superfamily I helicase
LSKNKNMKQQIENLELELIRANERQLDHQFIINRMMEAERKCEALITENKDLKRKLRKKTENHLTNKII